jgi:hypothetical protein
MYLHIGANKMVDIRSIVAIFRFHPSKMEKSNSLKQYYRPLVLLDPTKGLDGVRCYVVTEDCIYASPLRLETIVQRFQKLTNQQKWDSAASGLYPSKDA